MLDARDGLFWFVHNGFLVVLCVFWYLLSMQGQHGQTDSLQSDLT